MVCCCYMEHCCVTGVSGEKVEIDPVQVRSSIRLIRQKPVTHEADSIADCDLLEKKSNGQCLHFVSMPVSQQNLAQYRRPIFSVFVHEGIVFHSYHQLFSNINLINSDLCSHWFLCTALAYLSDFEL